MAVAVGTRTFPYVEGVEHRFVDIGDLALHVAEAGAGDPLVMLHGWPQHWYQWRNQIPALAERYRVICPDLRGFGWSQAPPRGYEKETLADDIVRLLDVLDLPPQKIRLVGHDWGGWIGFILCLRHPERFERFLALNIPPPWREINPRILPALWRFWYQAVVASPAGPWVLRTRPGLVRHILNTDTPRERSEEENAAFIEPLREPERAQATTQLYRTFLLREFFAILRGRYNDYRLTVPTRLLFGTRDFAISTAFLEGDWDKYADDLRIEFVPTAGHFIAEDEPELVTRRALELFGA
jgi:pimeloyl-ACP methyl ester carboxylesterase